MPMAHCQIRILSDKLKMHWLGENPLRPLLNIKNIYMLNTQKTPSTIESTVFGKYFVTFFITHPYPCYPSIIHIVSLPFALHHPYPLADIYAFLKAS